MKKLTLILSMMIALIGFNANAAMYIVGNAPFGDWNPGAGVEMTDNGDGTYTLTTAINGTVYFVFGDGLNSDWNTFNANYRIGPLSSVDQEVTTEEGWVTTQKAPSGSKSYKFTGTGGDYVFTFDATNMQFKIEGYVAPITYDSFTVAGSSAALFGTTWDPTNTANDMTLVNGLYTFNKSNVELTAGNLAFKVVADHDPNYGAAWPANDFIQAVEKHGLYDVEITFNEGTKDIECNLDLLQEIVDPIVEDCYIIAGTENLFGSNWNPADSANLMTLDAESGLYTWTKSNVVFEDVDTIEFKVVKNLDWANGSWPQDNYWHRIAEAGTYDFVITFDPNAADESKITFSATKQGGEEPPVVEFTSFTVAGPAAVFGTEWNAADENNDMVLDAETGLYTWTMDTVALTESFGFKVVGNHNWDYCWPVSDENGDNNWIVNIDKAGNYSLLITFNAETKEIYCTPTYLDGEEPVETVYTVAGPAAIFGSDWNAEDTNNDMTLDAESGLYTWTKSNVELTTGFGFKVVADHSWDQSWPDEAFANYDVAVEEAGIYTIFITFNADSTKAITCTLTKTGDIEPVHYDGDVYILGEVNDNGGWFPNVGVQMTRDAENNVYTATITTAGENDGYSYFSFTKKIAENTWENGGWDEIAGDRFGAETNDFEVTEEVLGQELTLVNYANAYKIPAGKWNLTLSVDNMTLVITKAAGYERGDVNMDGTVDVNDVTRLIDVNLGKVVEYDAAAADCNIDGGDGSIDINDVTALIARLLSGAWAN
jgi:hypothetical protein